MMLPELVGFKLLQIMCACLSGIKANNETGINQKKKAALSTVFVYVKLIEIQSLQMFLLVYCISNL